MEDLKSEKVKMNKVESNEHVELSFDTLYTVFRHLLDNFEDILSAGRVCKKWNKASKKEKLWKEACERRWGSTELLHQPSGPIEWWRVFKENHLLTNEEDVKVVRVKFVPELEYLGGKDCGLLESKFGGKPFMCESDEWPMCGGCHKKLAFILQLNLSQIPEQTLAIEKSPHLLQLFVCIPDDQCFVGFDFAGGFVRKVCIENVSEHTPEYEWCRNHSKCPTEVELRHTPLAARRVVGWKEEKCMAERVADLSFPISNKSLYAHHLESERRGKVELQLKNWRHVEGLKVLLEESLPFGFKTCLGGFPYWVQGEDYRAKCVHCGKMATNFIMQVESGDSIDGNMFGDGGSGEISLLIFSFRYLT